MRNAFGAFAVAIVALACARTAPNLPAQLLGTWQTNAPAYAGRSLFIASRSLAFSTGPSASNTYSVRSHESLRESDGSLLVVVSYRGEGGDMSLRLRLLPTNPPSLQLGERPERWSRLLDRPAR